MTISLVINCDTRPGQDSALTRIGDHGSGSLQGCRSWDFLTDGVVNKQRFFRGHWTETIVVVDEHEPIPETIRAQIAGSGSQMVIVHPPKTAARWNDWLYVESLKLATGDYVVHFDQDAAAFRRDECDILNQYLEWLDSGYKYVCQPTQISDHGMTHASTRFFMCKRETLDFPEIEHCLLDQKYFEKQYPGIHAPCLEHYLGAIAGPGSVLYPPADNQNYCVFSWVAYHRNTLAALNSMPYDEVAKYVFERCGVHGASDVIGQSL